MMVLHLQSQLLRSQGRSTAKYEARMSNLERPWVKILNFKKKFFLRAGACNSSGGAFVGGPRFNPQYGGKKVIKKIYMEKQKES